MSLPLALALFVLSPMAPQQTFQGGKAFARYLPVQGIGVHASFRVDVQGTIAQDRVQDRAFQVTITSAAAQQLTLSVSGSVEIFVGNATKPAQTFALQSAWFPTIRSAGSSAVYLYAARGTTIQVPKGKSVRARVTVSPVFAVSGQGASPVGAGTLDVVLQ